MSFLTRTALRASPFAARAAVVSSTTTTTRPSYNALARRAYTMSSIKSETLVQPKDENLRTQDGDVLSMHYTGTLQADGSTFDSSRENGKPFEFKLGAGQVIRGWDQGLQGMGVGERRKLTLPPAYAYGPRGFPPVIPPNATLVFDVELLEIKNRKD
ncbi:Peptidyl-prolyl cis-trans isomerase fpr2 [Ceratobasidium sp. 395]|nr:Peptidyl-prolyl cis-trans isomerase fpr2 [Ceratobasidium sp. 395]